MKGAPDARATVIDTRVTVTDTKLTVTVTRLAGTDTEANRAGVRREGPTETLDLVETLEA